MTLSRRISAALLTLLGLVGHAQAIVEFDASRRVASGCNLVQEGETIYLDVYVYPDYVGVHYQGALTGWTEGGYPVTANGTISVSRRGRLVVELDSLVIDETCNGGSVRANAIAWPF